MKITAHSALEHLLYDAIVQTNKEKKDFEDAGFYAISDLHTDTESDVKILGNIYDNPDLIKKE